MVGHMAYAQPLVRVSRLCCLHYPSQTRIHWVDSGGRTARSTPVKRHRRPLHSLVFVNARPFDSEQPESARHTRALAVIDEKRVRLGRPREHCWGFNSSSLQNYNLSFNGDTSVRRE